MRQYRVGCVWQLYGVAHVEAESLDEAIEQVKAPDFSLPDGDYVEDSFEVDEEITRSGLNDEPGS